MFLVEVHGVALVDALKDFGKRGLPRLDQEVYVVAHQHVGIEEKVVSPLIQGEYVEILQKVGTVFEYFLPLVAARDNMIKCAIEFDSRFARHAQR